MIFPPKRSNGKGDCPATPDDSFSPTLNWCLPGLVLMAITWTRERERETKNFAVLAFGLMQVLFLRGGGLNSPCEHAQPFLLIIGRCMRVHLIIVISLV